MVLGVVGVIPHTLIIEVVGRGGSRHAQIGRIFFFAMSDFIRIFAIAIRQVGDWLTTAPSETIVIWQVCVWPAA